GLLGAGEGLDGAGGGDVRAGVHRVVVRPQGADRRRQVDLAAVDLFPEGPGQRLCDVDVGHRPEELPVLAGSGGDPEGGPHYAAGHGVGEGTLAALPLGTGPSHGLGLPDRPLARGEREVARQQVVPGVARRHLDDVTLVAERSDVGVEHDLHRITYGSRATSRALLTAAATSRWCCEQVPVTLRARIFPRSETNRRSSATSLKST